MRFAAAALALAGLLVALRLDEAALGRGEFPATQHAPVTKLRLFYGALALVATWSVVRPGGWLAVYAAGVLLFAGVPTLGHQAIGLTPARGRSRALRVAWLASLAFPFVALAVAGGAAARVSFLTR